METTNNPQNNESTVLHFDIIGRQPTQQEVARLTSIVIEKKPTSGEEIKLALSWFAVGIGSAIFFFLFGSWVIPNFRGLGVLFFGYCFAYILAPASLIFAIVSLSRLFRSAQKTKPEAALRWVYEVSYLGDDTAGERFGELEYAVSTLERIVPSAIVFNKEAARQHIGNFRETLVKEMEQPAAYARQNTPADWKEGGAQKQLKIDSTKELYPGVLEICATITYKDMLGYSDKKNNTVSMVASVLELHVVSVMIRAGKYWYPYELFPTITSRQKLQDDSPVKETTPVLQSGETN